MGNCTSDHHWKKTSFTTLLERDHSTFNARAIETVNTTSYSTSQLTYLQNITEAKPISPCAPSNANSTVFTSGPLLFATLASERPMMPSHMPSTFASAAAGQSSGRDARTGRGEGRGSGDWYVAFFESSSALRYLSLMSSSLTSSAIFLIRIVLLGLCAIHKSPLLFEL